MLGPKRDTSGLVLIQGGSEFQELLDMTAQCVRPGSGSQIDDESAQVCDGRVEAG
jgi:hypothetical protein